MPSSPDPLIVTSQTRLRVIVADEVNSSLAKVLEALKPELAQPKAWLSNKEAMAYLGGLSRSTLARFRKDGTLPYSKLGAHVYYRLGDIERVLESRLQPGAE